jgi:hypothetical protein
VLYYIRCSTRITFRDEYMLTGRFSCTVEVKDSKRMQAAEMNVLKILEVVK